MYDIVPNCIVYCTVELHIDLCRTILYNISQYNIIQCKTNVVRYSTLQCKAVIYKTYIIFERHELRSCSIPDGSGLSSLRVVEARGAPPK